MDRTTTRLIHKRLDRIKESCEEAIEAINLSEDKADVNGDERYDFYASDDARNYFWRILEEVEEAQGQWWA